MHWKPILRIASTMTASLIPLLTWVCDAQEKVQALPAVADPYSVQLTIALAPGQGESPGPPMTLEILPTGHSCQPHDNARACGLIRVLHGNMDGRQPIAVSSPHTTMTHFSITFLCWKAEATRSLPLPCGAGRV